MAADLKSLETMVEGLTAQVATLAKTPAVDPKGVIGTATSGANGVPAVRKGESSMSSRPFRFTKLFGAMAGQIDESDAKVEMQLCKSFRSGLEDTDGVHAEVGNGAMVPVAKSYLGDSARDHQSVKDIFESMAAGAAESVDYEEVAWTAKNKSFGPSVRKTAMSYLDDSIGGALVAPPEMGEIIPLMRNKSAVAAAGARQVALPPQGKWVAPRITGPSTGYWITENAAITESNPTTGQVSMQAKKLAVLIRVPNELFKFATATNDAMLKDDMSKTLALGFDWDCLYGPGAGRPKGIVNYTGTNELLDYAGTTPAPKGLGTNGNTLQPQDGYRMVAGIEDRNFDPQSWKWIMRPRMKGTILSYRADAVTAGDQASLFVQDLTRSLGMGAPANWCGYPIVASAQVRNNQVKSGSGATLTEIFGGVWSEFLQGIYGAMEFATSTQGGTEFEQDQTRIRAIMFCDAVPRYPGAFTWYQQLLLA